ncbi:DUF6192 family protein [Streptomyces sp. NPDC050523]|uniref:DUF6192 family protein n=1 Tax=Streptomyces sp. NPDC050523 TaxID=3365622 RepID=UPI0037BB08C9
MSSTDAQAAAAWMLQQINKSHRGPGDTRLGQSARRLPTGSCGLRKLQPFHPLFQTTVSLLISLNAFKTVRGDAAKRAAGWASATPVTVAEKVETIRDLAQDEQVAAQAACDLLHRPEVAFRAMRDRQARELVNQAQFDQAELVEEGDEEESWWEENDAEQEDGVVDPVAIVRGFHRAMEFTDLIGVCQGFVAGASRLVPRLRGREFSESQLDLVTRHLEKIRATADWIETAVSTGKVDLDEALAELLRGQ